MRWHCVMALDLGVASWCSFLGVDSLLRCSLRNFCGPAGDRSVMASIFQEPALCAEARPVATATMLDSDSPEAKLQ